MTEDSIVDAVKSDLDARSERGLSKYGVTLDRTDITREDWMRHAYEELLDGALYIKKLMTLDEGRCEGCIHAPTQDRRNYENECGECRRFYADGFRTTPDDGDE
jgi:hypothetical protein